MTRLSLATHRSIATSAYATSTLASSPASQNAWLNYEMA